MLEQRARRHVEGATAPIYPDIDISLDGRVEDFGPVNGGKNLLSKTSDMFGDQGMTGLHAVERILYVSSTPATVVIYEASLGYVPAHRRRSARSTPLSTRISIRTWRRRSLPK